MNTILVCHALVFILCVVDNQNTYKWQLPGGSKHYQKEPLYFSGNFNVNERICFLRGAHFFAEKRNVIRVSISTSARASLYAFYRKIKTHLSWGLIEFLAVSALEKRCGWGF